MNNDFDLKQVGKRMPYTTPDNFFNRLESDIYSEVKSGKALKSHRRLFRLRVATGFLAVAACMTALFIMTLPHRNSATESIQNVEQSFSNLSAADQAYMLDTYQEDPFLNE